MKDQNYLEAMAEINSPESKAKRAKENALHDEYQEANKRIGREATFEGGNTTAKVAEFQRKDNWYEILRNVYAKDMLPAQEDWDTFITWLETNAGTFCNRKSYDFYDRSWWREAVLEGYLKALKNDTVQAYEVPNG